LLKLDRIETRDLEYQEKVRHIYLSFAAEETQRFLVLDATLKEEDLATIIQIEVAKRFLS
jgi:thymidylate kinase